MLSGARIVLMVFEFIALAFNVEFYTLSNLCPWFHAIIELMAMVNNVKTIIAVANGSCGTDEDCLRDVGTPALSIVRMLLNTVLFMSLWFVCLITYVQYKGFREPPRREPETAFAPPMRRRRTRSRRTLRQTAVEVDPLPRYELHEKPPDYDDGASDRSSVDDPGADAGQDGAGPSVPDQAHQLDRPPMTIVVQRANASDISLPPQYHIAVDMHPPPPAQTAAATRRPSLA
nr:hypothetical protein HK105_003071 [Polyrhizophydium stewartii]